MIFGKLLFHKKHRNAVLLAHSMKSYHGVFLVKYIPKNSIKPNKILYDGTKIMYMQVERGLNIRVLDSINILPMKLA